MKEVATRSGHRQKTVIRSVTLPAPRRIRALVSQPASGLGAIARATPGIPGTLVPPEAPRHRRLRQARSSECPHHDRSDSSAPVRRENRVYSRRGGQESRAAISRHLQATVTRSQARPAPRRRTLLRLIAAGQETEVRLWSIR